MNIKISELPAEKRKPKPLDETKLGFGQILADHMFLMDWVEGKGWINPRVEPYHSLSLDPAAMSLHYGQLIFEGLKCYRRKDGGLQLFRAIDNVKRLNRSARRLCMPEVEEGPAIEAMKALIRVDHEWVPRAFGTSLYVRPTMVATEPHLGVRPSKEYVFFLIIGPVGAYYAEGFNPVRIKVEDKFVRAAPGGLGEAKTACNYAASLLAQENAHAAGFTQVLWLDGVERKYVEEVGTMNMFFLFDDELVTAPLEGTILPGVTRQTVLDLTRTWGDLKVAERKIAIDEVMAGAKSGRLKEAFGSGTAAVISPVGEIQYKGELLKVADGRTGALANKLFNEITAIQYGSKPDAHGWIEKITL